jgi:transcriptional regulator with XRE-family HTH domain
MGMRTDRPQETTLRRLDPAAVVKTARTIAGLSQRQLAEMLGTKQSVISRWERGQEVPRADTLGRILHACGFEVDLRFRRHDDVDRSQIVQQLSRTPAERAEFVSSAVSGILEAREAIRASSAA